METLTPIQEEPKESRQDIPKELSDAGIDLKNVQFLNYLGLKDEMFNSYIMEKIQFLSDSVFDVDSLLDLDIRLGEDNGMSKLDKIYSYLKLNEQADKIRNQERLIREQMRKYESS